MRTCHGVSGYNVIRPFPSSFTFSDWFRNYGKQPDISCALCKILWPIMFSLRIFRVASTLISPVFGCIFIQKLGKQKAMNGILCNLVSCVYLILRAIYIWDTFQWSRNSYPAENFPDWSHLESAEKYMNAINRGKDKESRRERVFLNNHLSSSLTNNSHWVHYHKHILFSYTSKKGRNHRIFRLLWVLEKSLKTRTFSLHLAGYQLYFWTVRTVRSYFPGHA